MKVHSGSITNKNLKDVPFEIPNSILNEDWAKINHSQTLSRLNERGCITVSEALDNIHGRRLNFSHKETQKDVDELNSLIRKIYETD